MDLSEGGGRSKGHMSSGLSCKRKCVHVRLNNLKHAYLLLKLEWRLTAQERDRGVTMDFSLKLSHPRTAATTKTTKY